MSSQKSSSYRPSKVRIAGFQCIELFGLNEPMLVGEHGEIWIYAPNVFGVAIADPERALTLLQDIQVWSYEDHGRSIVFAIDGSLLKKVIDVVKPFKDCSKQIHQAEAMGPLLTRTPDLDPLVPVAKACDKQEQFFDNQLLDYKQAAQYLGISESYLRRLKRKKKISFVQVGDRGIRFRVSSLNRWIEEREVK